MASNRRRTWADFLISDTLADGVVNLDNLLVNAPTVDTLTVVRLVGDFVCTLSSTSEIETLQTVDVGIGVINSEAMDLGTGVGVPNPTVEDSYPPRGWLYVARLPVLQALPTGATPTAMWRETAHFQFDLGAMRKIDKGVLFMWREANVIQGSAMSLNCIGRVRALCLT